MSKKHLYFDSKSNALFCQLSPQIYLSKNLIVLLLVLRDNLTASLRPIDAPTTAHTRGKKILHVEGPRWPWLTINIKQERNKPSNNSKIVSTFRLTKINPEHNKKNVQAIYIIIYILLYYTANHPPKEVPCKTSKY